jgi:uncharacterized protein (TIGR03085 family)
MADSKPDAGAFVASERAALCDLFDELGPDAPTLSGDWTTRDLAAHLWAREHRPDAGPGLVLGGPFGTHTDKVQSGVAERPYAEVVADLRSGPPWWAFGRWVPSMDVHEWYVHHEDVRRANGGSARDLGDDEGLVWAALGRFAKMLTRSLDVGLRLESVDGRSRDVRSGDTTVVVTGTAGELMLCLFGRDVAEVELGGDPEAVAAFEAASFGL